jgi:cytosine/adenosine deaminase-related metal-dependent hydrolase/ubiquinone/menaquinone biosynthesis C-methylase UbiE
MTSTVKIPVLPRLANQKHEFALWSAAYDETPNPLLCLEQRFLTPMLGSVQDKDVLDVGCGTGRWLAQLSESTPQSLTGIDFSPEMLDRAQRKLGRRALLAAGDATSLPVANSSADVVLASFVASYVSDLDAFAGELRRVLRSAGKIYISDVHPGTAAMCGWKRGFRTETQQIELVTRRYSLSEILSSFRHAGFEVTFLLEPAFGLPELEIFREAGKTEAYYAAAGMPAIYVLGLEPGESDLAATFSKTKEVSAMSLTAARVAIDAEASVSASVHIRDGRVDSIVSHNGGDLKDPLELDLDGYLLLPGLINAHDHLEFGLYPNLGAGPYANSLEWADAIQREERATIEAHQSIPRDVRLWWGAIRNLLCGVTTVCHHNALHPELSAEDFPVRVVSDYRWSHSLAIDNQVDAKFKDTPENIPFVLHACEGVDEASANEIFRLDNIGALDDRTVLVHGLALSPEGIELLNARSAAVVWCPSSNRFLFNRTLSNATVAAIRRVALGSDSPLTAAGDLLDEIRIARHEIGVSANELYCMVLTGSADVFRLREGQGILRPGSTADLIAIRETGSSPAETLANMSADDVELVIARGRVKLASDEIARRLPSEAVSRLQPLEVDSTLRWIQAPLSRLFREAEKVLGNDIKIGGKRVRHVCSAWL